MKTTTSLRLRLKVSALSTQQRKRQTECGSPGSGVPQTSAASLTDTVNHPPSLLSRWHGLLAGCVMLATSAQAAITLSGRVTDGGVGLSGIRINYSWIGPFNGTGSDFATTDGNGNWSSSGWGPGYSVTIAPSQAGYTWSPPSRSVNTGLSDIGGLNFARISYSISGTVSEKGAGVSGVAVSLTGALSRNTTTATNGSFSYTFLRTGTYTITPSQSGYLFVPANRVVTLSPSRPAQDFERVSALVTTLAPTDVALGDATLQGTLVGEGTLPNNVRFEYRAGNVGLYTSTPIQSLPPGTAVTPVKATIHNLLPGVIYTYRLVAANPNGINTAQSAEFAMPYPGAGKALNLDDHDYVQIADNNSLDLTNNYTLECWFKADAFGGLRGLISKYHTVNANGITWPRSTATARGAFTAMASSSL